MERDVDALLDQLGLDHTFFIELGLVAALFLFLSHTYFKPFMKLFAARYSKTVKDREAAELLMSQAQTKFEEYKRVLAEEKSAARTRLYSSNFVCAWDINSSDEI